jgi:hypothetical protein
VQVLFNNRSFANCRIREGNLDCQFYAVIG